MENVRTVKLRHMKVTIDINYCKSCRICINACIKSVFAMSEERQNSGALLPFAAYAERCTGCGLCEMLCPDGCINVEEEERV